MPETFFVNGINSHVLCNTPTKKKGLAWIVS